MTIGNDVTMFYNAKPIIFDRAKALRNNMTHAEQVIWEMLKANVWFKISPSTPNAFIHCRLLLSFIKVSDRN